MESENPKPSDQPQNQFRIHKTFRDLEATTPHTTETRALSKACGNPTEKTNLDKLKK